MDKDEAGQDKNPQTPSRTGKKEVDLFPGVVDRKSAPAMVTFGRQQAGAHIGTHISMFAPLSFDDAVEIVECLRERSATTICLEKMKKSDAGRLVDFISGASAAIDGDFHKLSDNVFLFCPSNIKIVASGKETQPTVGGKGPGGALDFLYPDRMPGDKGTYGSLWNKS